MGFLDACAEAREWIEKRDNLLVVHHYDADGLSGGALAAGALERMGKAYSRLCYRKISGKEIEEIIGRKEKSVLFVDFGSGAIDGLEKIGKDVVVIDHHPARESGILQANPMLFGIDGATEMSGASAAYFVFGVRELAPMGIVGAVGDMQAPLSGWNKRMLKEGEEAGAARHYNDLSMFGRLSRPLTQFLVFSIDPYFPGLTGNEDAVRGFYESLGIGLRDGERWRTYLDLSDEEKMLLRSALASYLHEKGRGWAAKSLIGEVYELLTYPKGTEMRDASEFSTLLNACGRHNRPDVGVDTLLKRPGAYAVSYTHLTLPTKRIV